MYNLEALKAEIVRMEKHAELFESKIKEIREQIVQHRIWITEQEKNGRNN